MERGVGRKLASNFGFLSWHDEQLVRLGMLAERYFPEDPNTALLKLRQFGEVLAPPLALHIDDPRSSDKSVSENYWTICPGTLSPQSLPGNTSCRADDAWVRIDAPGDSVDARPLSHAGCLDLVGPFTSRCL